MNPSNKVFSLLRHYKLTIIAWKEVMLQIDNSFMTVEISTSVLVILEKIRQLSMIWICQLHFICQWLKKKLVVFNLDQYHTQPNIFLCVSSSFYSIPVLTQFIVTISDISTPGITGFQSIEVESFFQEQYMFCMKRMKGHWEKLYHISLIQRYTIWQIDK